MKHNPDFYLKAAELLFKSYEEYLDNLRIYSFETAYVNTEESRFTCDNIDEVGYKSGLEYWEILQYQKLYESYFKPEDREFGWWPTFDDGGWDYESRLLALLFMVEIAKDLNKGKKKSA